MDLTSLYITGWDVCNKVSDVLMLRMNREVCSCGSADTDIIIPTSSPSNSMLSSLSQSNYDDYIRKYSSIFNRYILLKDLMDGEML